MDFFQEQENAIRKTKRLVLYFAIGVVLIIVAVYLAVTAGVVAYDFWTQGEQGTIDTDLIWDPGRFLLTLVAVVACVGLGSLYKTLSLRGGGSAVATSLGGERVDRSTRDHKRKQLLNVVEEMAIASGVPVPEVYILTQEASINAFAAGWGMDDAVVAVSAGALESLSRDELQGVVAHEYSHILHGDCRLNIRLMGILFGIMMLTILGRVIGAVFRGGGRRRGGTVVYMGGGRRRSSSGGGGGKGGGGALILAVILVVVLITIIGYIGTVFARLIQAAISRQREFLADAAAVQFTRNPEGIAGALKKIGGSTGRGVLEHPSAGEAAHMFFADGLKRPFASALATHPPLKKRIQQIQPNWDGTFTEAQATPEPESGDPSPSPSSKPVDPGKFIQGMTILGAIGTLSSENMATAKRIKSAIPDAMDTMMREPQGARESILALLAADNDADDEDQWKVLKEVYPEADCGRIRALEGQIKTLPREVRLGILELATTTLAQSTELDRVAFLKLVDRLIQADQQVSHYEFSVRRILRERLNRGARKTPAQTAVRYNQVEPPVAEAVSVLLSVVAREVSASPQPEQLIEKALLEKYLLLGKVAYRPPGEGGLEQLDAALDTLKVSSFAIRAQTLRAVVACIQEDGELSPDEAETLRMISLSLDCPVPPLGI